MAHLWLHATGFFRDCEPSAVLTSPQLTSDSIYSESDYEERYLFSLLVLFPEEEQELSGWWVECWARAARLGAVSLQGRANSLKDLVSLGSLRADRL